MITPFDRTRQDEIKRALLKNQYTKRSDEYTLKLMILRINQAVLWLLHQYENNKKEKIDD